ncbi:MAG: hypothetical protein Q9219_000661 [cf. Caloplaca sp. 3 TL-2023]
MNTRQAVKDSYIQADVDALERPWRHGFDEIDLLPDDQLTNRIVMDNWRTMQYAERMEEREYNSFGSGNQSQPSRTDSSSSTARQQPRHSFEEPAFFDPGSRQMTPRGAAPDQHLQGARASPPLSCGNSLGQPSTPGQQRSGPGLPVPNPIPNHLLPLLVPQLACQHPSGTAWGATQQAPSDPQTHQRHPSYPPQHFGFVYPDAPHHQRGAPVTEPAGRGQEGQGQVRPIYYPPPQPQDPSHLLQPSSPAPGAAMPGPNQHVPPGEQKHQEEPPRPSSSR